MTDNNPAFDKLIIDAVGYLNDGDPGAGADSSGVALKLEPGRCEGYFTLAIAAYLLDDLGRALEMAQKGHDIAPECREGCDILAHLHAHADNINDSVYFAKIAATGESLELLAPLRISGLDDLAGAIDGTNKTDYMTKALRCLHEERYSDAVAVCEKELRLRKNDPAGFEAFSKALLGDGKIGQGISALQAATHLDPDNASVQLQLGSAYYRAGEPSLAMACHNAALAKCGGKGDVLAEISHMHSGHSDAEWPALADAVTAWRGQNAAKGASASSTSDEDVTNIGFVFDRACVSDDLSYIEPLMLNFDRNRFAISVFSRDVPGDPVANRMKGLCQSWTDIRDMTEATIIATINALKIDVLVDATVTPTGHCPGVFSAHPAGMTLDWLSPAHGIFSELYDSRLRDLSEVVSGIAIDPANMAEIKGRSPVHAREHVTFAAQCDFSRISPEVVCAWSSILRAVPDSRLVLGDENIIPDDVKRRAYELFSAFGAVDRVDFAELGSSGPEDRLVKRLEFLVGTDVYLDPFPLSGRTDINCALWCGVPVVSMRGSAGPALGTILAAGMDEWLADSIVDYVQKSILAAETVTENDDYREQMHDRVRSSLMCDPKQWAGQFGDVIEKRLAE